MREEITERLTAVREAVTGARSMPMSSSAVINRAELLALVDDLEAAIHQGFSEATEVVGGRDAVVASGHEEAARILKEARERQDQMVSDTDVYQLAVQRAEEIRSEARTEADEMRVGADKYVEEKLAGFELALERILDTVKRGRSRINEGYLAGLSDDSDVSGADLPDHLQRGRFGD